MKSLKIENFSIKFIDIMIGLVLGLGFDSWTKLKEPWQYAAFIFAYLDIVDFWIDYGPALKKFSPKREIDVFLDLAICFSLFLYIYSTLFSITFFIAAFCLIKIFDFFWLLSSKIEYKPDGFDKKYLNTWMVIDLIEIILATIIIAISSWIYLSALIVLIIFIIVRVISRILASVNYKKLYLSN